MSEPTVNLRALINGLVAAKERRDEVAANRCAKALLIELIGDVWEPRIVFYPVIGKGKPNE